MHVKLFRGKAYWNLQLDLKYTQISKSSSLTYLHLINTGLGDSAASFRVVYQLSVESLIAEVL